MTLSKVYRSFTALLRCAVLMRHWKWSCVVVLSILLDWASLLQNKCLPSNISYLRTEIPDSDGEMWAWPLRRANMGHVWRLLERMPTCGNSVSARRCNTAQRLGLRALQITWPHASRFIAAYGEYAMKETCDVRHYSTEKRFIGFWGKTRNLIQGMLEHLRRRQERWLQLKTGHLDHEFV